VEAVLNLLKAHSEKYKPPKQATPKLESWSGWAALAGAVIYVVGEVLRQPEGSTSPFLRLGYVLLSLLGLIIFTIGALVLIVQGIRTTRRPILEYLDGVIEACPRERDLISSLDSFEPAVLEFVCKRLQMERVHCKYAETFYIFIY
jgi:hypothetical protein